MTTTNSKIGSRNATTLYKTLSIYGNNFASLVECQLLTGRTHQIRVHLESEKHSIIGDQTYSSCQKQMLDAQNNENYQRVFCRFKYKTVKKIYVCCMYNCVN